MPLSAWLRAHASSTGAGPAVLLEAWELWLVASDESYPQEEQLGRWGEKESDEAVPGWLSFHIAEEDCAAASLQSTRAAAMSGELHRCRMKKQPMILPNDRLQACLCDLKLGLGHILHHRRALMTVLQA